MSDEQKETGKEPAANTPESVEVNASTASTENPSPAKPADKPAEAVAAKPAAAKPAAEPPPPIPAGPFGKALASANIPVKHLGADASGVEMLDIAPADLLRAGEYLRDKHQFDLLMSCSGVDWKDRLESVYHLYSTQSHQYLALKVSAIDGHSPSLMSVWHAADWHEREAYDLFGIHYDGHSNLTRILMPSDWLGHPLRKDYKVDDPRLVWNER
jgi:NADH-quinone oxidoreductase subunit C